MSESKSPCPAVPPTPRSAQTLPLRPRLRPAGTRKAWQPSSPGLVVLSQQHQGWWSAGTGRPSQTMRHFPGLPGPRPRCLAPPTTLLPVCLWESLPRPGQLLPAKDTTGYPRGCLRVSGAGPKAGRRVRQPSGSCGHCPAGHCSRNSLGVSIFSVQRTGQLYGSRNKAASVCHPGGGGEGAARRVMNPARSPGLWQSQASQEPPTLFPKGKGRKFLPPGRQGVPEDGQKPPPALGYHSLPSCSLLLGDVPGQRVQSQASIHASIRLQTFAQSLLCAKVLQPSSSNQDTPQI